MKKYLFGLGTMLVGAGLMFVLMHGEVSADDLNKVKCEKLNIFGHDRFVSVLSYCKVKDLTCVFAPNGRISCVKS